MSSITSLKGCSDHYTISVIIPSYNRLNWLSLALDSVLAQTYSAYEIIVVDDGSTDQTEQLISSQYPMVHYISQKHAGVSKARNTGIACAAGNWLAFLDSDDRWQPEKLATQVALLQQSPQALVCHSDELWIRDGRRVNPMQKHKKPSGWIYSLCLARCMISPSSILCAREVFERVGVFDETLPACEDYDLWLRITAVYPVILCEQALVIKYGGHADQLSRHYWGMDRFRVQALIKMLESDLLNPANRVATLDCLQKKLLILCQGAKKRGYMQRANDYSDLIQKYAMTGDIL